MTKPIKGGNKSGYEVVIMVEMLVRDAMTESFVKLSPQTMSSGAAKIMADSDADCILVMDEEKPLGIVTASDFLRRIVAEGKDASKIAIKKIMSSPVITVDVDRDLSEALRRLSSNAVKRLVVLEGEDVAGIVTSVDLLFYAEELGEPEEEREVGPSMCEICGGYFEVLTDVGGKFVCEDCKEMLEG
jgi:signal-transduction protein with cAMP-binding, CBS, and nucleotidyltransferase domain